MDDFAKLRPEERSPFFEETASRRNSTTTAMEKDFWVCWTLKHLFSIRGIPELRFKGGTSLSKVFKVINRFSEDIDISIDRAGLGFTGANDPANSDLSNTARKAVDQKLRLAIEDHVKQFILPKLKASMEAVLGTEGWTLEPSAEPNDEMTLVFNYPPAFRYREYLKPSIKIEFGRGDQQPFQEFTVTPFVAEEFGDEFAEPATRIRVLDCERTFWEKVTLLHAENHREGPTRLRPRMSRHWSDVAVMSGLPRFAAEALNLNLLKQVIAFKKVYFAANWAQYDRAVPGTLNIVPNDKLQKILREDYKQMREMFVEEPLSFDEVLGRLQALQKRINELA